jgi:hypothetical protein
MYIFIRDLGEGEAADELIAQRWSSLDAVAMSVRRTIERICSLFGEETYSEQIPWSESNTTTGG